MQPSSDRPSGTAGGGGSALRRYGPIAAIVAVVAVIGSVVLLGGDDEDVEQAATGDTTAETQAGETAAADTVRPEGAVSWTQAEEEGLDVSFPETCDPETGRVAIPYYYAPECFADVAENGGATSRGVTEDTITVVYYVAPAADPVLDFITGPIDNDDTPEQIAETVQGYAQYRSVRVTGV